MIIKLKNDTKKFTHIIHVADIHIRLNTRHQEYKNIFKKLYEEIKKSPETTLVAILGDTLHSKVDLSPECVQMASDLFKNIADIRPLILVAGNHDCILSNKSRLDSLTPIVNALDHSNLYYLKTTGLYGIGNILFNNMCVFDSPEAYIRGENIPSIYRNEYEHIIALFHGPVDGACTENGFKLSNPAIMTPLFDNNDIALLGDIHLMQNMQDYSPDEHKPCVRYPSSLIQQSHGEPLEGHGYSLWNLSDRSYKHIEIPNDYGYFTIEVHKGSLVTDISKLPKNVHLRVQCYETISSELKIIISKIKQLVNVVEVSYVRMDKELDKSNIIPIGKDIVWADLSKIDYQNKLIVDFLYKKLNITDKSKIEDILAINRDNNTKIKKDEFSRNIKWKPVRFEWDNMFKYGEGNVIDFTQMSGIYGVFGPNKSGKSSILSAMIFCLFDKFDRGFKGIHALNIQKSTFRCKLEFEISDIHYFIERKGTTGRNGSVKVDVKFWREIDGKMEELHGTERRDTNDVIRDYIGTYEDFILTAASFQTAKNNASFIDMGNSERKDLLVQFMGLNIFDRLHKSAGERNKELGTILKMHKDKNYSDEKQQNQNALNHAISLISDINKEIEDLKKQINNINEEILRETANLIKLDDNIPTDLPALTNKRLGDETLVRQKKSNSEILKKSLEEKTLKLEEVLREVKTMESSDLVENHKIYKILTDRINEITQKIEIKKKEIKGKQDKEFRLKTHEYDPNCKYCVNNSFVKDANQAILELIEDRKEIDHLQGSREIIREELSKVQWVEQAYEKYTKLLNQRSNIKDEHGEVSRNIIINNNELEKLELSLKSSIEKIELYHRNETSVERNKEVQAKILSYKNASSKLGMDLNKKNSRLMDLSGKKELFAAQIIRLDKTMEELKKQEYEYDSYQLYLESVSRDGIPYQVISNVVPQIEKEVNSILSQIDDFSILFETDGENIIPYICSTNVGKYPIELSSGFERFISSIAIRVALTEVSGLPRFTGLFIDEGFGTLDSDNMNGMPTLLSILKEKYDFIIIISHIDAMKDAVDKSIEISKEGGFSKVVFE